MVFSRILLSAVAVAAVVACTPPAPPAPAKPVVDAAAEAKAIGDIETQWNADWKAHDGAKIAAHYASDAALYTPGMAVATTSDAVGKMVAGALSDKNIALTFKADKVVVAASGDLAYSTGSYTMVTTNPKTKKPVTETGGYVTVYKKDGDAWKVVADINTPEPVAVVAAADATKPAGAAKPADAAKPAGAVKPADGSKPADAKPPG